MSASTVSAIPKGLKGAAIIPEVRLLASADVVEAALQQISCHRGTLFDAEVVDARVRVFRGGKFSFD